MIDTKFIPNITTVTADWLNSVNNTLVFLSKAIVSVKDFGAVGDGSTDDTAAIQAAVSFANSIGGGQVWFEAGKTYVSTKIVPKSNVLVNLKQSTLKAKAGTNAPLFYDSGIPGTNFGVINGTLDCNQVNNSYTNVIGGVWLSGWSYTQFTDLTITNCLRVGLYLNGSTYSTVRNYSFTNSGINGSGYFAYALAFEPAGTTRSTFVSVENMSVSNVYGFGIHFYKCDNFTAKNLNFDTLTYNSGFAIAITFTETNRGEVANVNCNSVGGDNIEINDSSDITLSNCLVNAAGNRALLVGYNTAGNYNNRIKVSRFTATNTQGSVSCALSACIKCDFDRLTMDKGVNVDSTLSLSGGNTVKDSSFGSTAATGLTGLGWFTLERVAFTDYTYRYLGKQTATISLTTTISNTTGVYSLDIASVLKGTFVNENVAAGTIRVHSYLNGSQNQGSYQKFDFLVNNYGTAANLSTVSTVANAVNRSLTIAGDATNKKITFSNTTVVDLTVSILIEFVTIR